MNALGLQEAQLLRLLQGIFGFDQVLPFISLLTICGGDLSSKISDQNTNQAVNVTVDNRPCLFTVIDPDHEPKLVVEFDAQNGQTIDVAKLNQQSFARAQLESKGIHYVLINEEEFEDILNPALELNLANFIHSKIQA